MSRRPYERAREFCESHPEYQLTFEELNSFALGRLGKKVEALSDREFNRLIVAYAHALDDEGRAALARVDSVLAETRLQDAFRAQRAELAKEAGLGLAHTDQIEAFGRDVEARLAERER